MAKISDAHEIVSSIVGFPPDPDDFFFELLLAFLADKYLYRPLTDETAGAVKNEALSLITVANERYTLGVDRDFWRVDVEQRDDRAVMIVVRPRSVPMYYNLRVYEHAEGGWVAEANITDDPSTAIFVRGPGKVLALVGLGKLMEKRNKENAGG